MIACEFCAEFQTDGPSRFRSSYQGVAAHRVVARSDRFVAVPTIGQMLEGSFLIIPIEHKETCAGMDDDARAEMLGLADKMVARCSRLGRPVVFEHGATSVSGGGCGIHHAHLHIVPLPWGVTPAELFPESAAEVADLATAWRALRGSSHYLLIGDGRRVLTRDLTTLPGEFPSQFFRRRIAEFFALETSWDWRSYPSVEQSLVRVLAEGVADAV
ncbi:HIT family protein [Sphingomonas carotinifaciens]|uniref:HIT family protein n=1 Tax=Sphingomonas carotinifaciens TaxID=1166323 RepID=UPI000DD9F407|nr:HIT domain-containing protein [Sphingomonas carotinifaciens]